MKIEIIYVSFYTFLLLLHFFLSKSLTFGYENVMLVTSPCFTSIIRTNSLKYTFRSRLRSPLFLFVAKMSVSSFSIAIYLSLST